MGRRERRRDREKLEWRVERREIRSSFFRVESEAWRQRERNNFFFKKRNKEINKIM